jgi:hypothetical protein
MVPSNAGRKCFGQPPFASKDVSCFHHSVVPVPLLDNRWTLIAAELGRNDNSVYSRYKEHHLVPNPNRGG